MDTKTTYPANPTAAETIQDLVSNLLSDGIAPTDISFCLAFTALDLALQSAPSPAHALLLVTSALSHASKAHCPDATDSTDSAAAPTDVSDQSADSWLLKPGASGVTVH